jgi:hypothetical protein
VRIFCNVPSAIHHTRHVHSREDYAESHMQSNKSPLPKVFGVSNTSTLVIALPRSLNFYESVKCDHASED